MWKVSIVDGLLQLFSILQLTLSSFKNVSIQSILWYDSYKNSSSQILRADHLNWNKF